MYAAFKVRTLQRGAYAYFVFATRTAVVLALAGNEHAAQAQEALLAAQLNRPKNLAENHRTVLALRYAEALISSGDVNSAAALAARKNIALAIGRSNADDLPAPLFGLLFY
jgi:hypothetical protein